MFPLVIEMWNCTIKSGHNDNFHHSMNNSILMCCRSLTASLTNISGWKLPSSPHHLSEIDSWDFCENVNCEDKMCAIKSRQDEEQCADDDDGSCGFVVRVTGRKGRGGGGGGGKREGGAETCPQIT